MTCIISTHSYRGGTGKSNISANLAALLALEGHRVGVVDVDIRSPGIHALFGVDPHATRSTLNDFLWGRCGVEDAVIDVTGAMAPDGVLPGGGKVLLVPSSMRTGESRAFSRRAMRSSCSTRASSTCARSWSWIIC